MTNGIHQTNLKITNWQIFSTLAILNLVLIWFLKEHIFRYEVFYHLFQEQLEISRIEHQLDLWRNWFNLNYLLVPCSLFLKLGFLAFILQFPLLFIEDDVAYKKVFRVIMFADLAMIGCTITQYATIYFKPINSIGLESFSRVPLSLAILLRNYSDLSEPAKMIINRFNVFELMWCTIIYYQLKILTRMKRIDILLLVTGMWIFLLIIQWLAAEIVMLLSI